jgi:hypothetical protein
MNQVSASGHLSILGGRAGFCGLAAYAARRDKARRGAKCANDPAQKTSWIPKVPPSLQRVLERTLILLGWLLSDSGVVRLERVWALPL